MNIINIIDLVDDNMDISYIRNINPNDTIIVGKMNKIIINYDRRNLIKSLFKLQNNEFEVSQYEEAINKFILESYKLSMMYV